MIIGYWSSLSFITFITICKNFVNVNFILVPYYMIHDIIYWDIIILKNFRYLSSSRTKSLIMSNESFGISTFSIRSSSILSYFLNWKFLSLEPIGLTCFKPVFGTNRPTMLQECYELILNIIGALVADIYIWFGYLFC